MFLGACLEIGLCPDQLESELRKLELPEQWTLHIEKGERASITGTYLEFRISQSGPAVDQAAVPNHSHGHGRHFSTIRDLIGASGLSQAVRHRAVAIFQRLGEAEAAVHGTTLEKVHFHEVGALDSILDIVGSAIAVEQLGITSITSSIPVDGEGFVQCAHGTFPVPVPAVLNILKGCVLRQIAVPTELITPTGAAILAELSGGDFKPLPEGKIEANGYGLGSKILEGRPNALRLILSQIQDRKNHGSGNSTFESVTLLETNLDDVSGEEISHAMDYLLSAGALDVALVPITMKKGRPGQQLQVMCLPDRAELLAEGIFTTTGTLGVRFRTQQRQILQRQIDTVQTKYGPIRVKWSFLNGKPVAMKPESDDIDAAAQNNQVSPRLVRAAAQASEKKES